MIILNEKEYAENCIKNKSFSGKPFQTLTILAKYYYHSCGFKKAKIEKLLFDFLDDAYPKYKYDKASWEENIEKIAQNAKKFTLYEIDGVWITKKELETVKNIHNKVLERLAFTLLCLAKLGNTKSEKNNGWVNYETKEIYTLARISCPVKERYEKLNSLYELGLLEFPRRLDNLSCRVTYINDDSENILFISDFRELGYEYLKYNGGNFTNCCECGILIRDNKNHTKRYCNNCVAYTPQVEKKIKCIDCGKEFVVSAMNNRTDRCSDCYEIYRREYKKNFMRITNTNKQ